MRPECRNKSSCDHSDCQFLRANEELKNLPSTDLKSHRSRRALAATRIVTYVVYVVAALAVPLV